MKILRLAAALVLLASPLPAQEATARFGEGGTEVLVRSTTDIQIIRPVIERFVTRNPDLSIRYEQWGSNALFDRSRADCQSGDAPADAIVSSAVQQMVWLVNAGCAQPYRSAVTLALPQARRWRDELWGITTEPAVIAYNKDLLSAEDVPRSRFALLDAMRDNPEFYRKRIATYDISESGLGFLFAYSDSLEATTFGALLEGFARIEAVATCCSAEIIAGVADGTYLLAYNVLGSYVLNADAATVGMVLPEDYTLVLSRGLMIPKGAAQPAAAGRLLEFLFTAEAQSLLAQAGLVVDTDDDDAGMDVGARRFIPLSPTLLVARDASHRDLLLRFWSETFRQAEIP
ncbi:ABC transporter substrate-binding protein [Chachezhania sediminis]|uniref:ABC transporter substrate-binding protein n=1 Tax=Chachezhania sediminis TaxID=2599291 RepID=UPI00131BE500|nr:extracellular solute-binding protein [Chachezhania sediminis]